MSPRRADPDIRRALVAAAARILAEEGPAAVSVRRVAKEVGTSTMAVYTHFGGKEELERAVCMAGFEGLSRRMARVRPTDDPVADLAALGRAYRRNALDQPHTFAAMFRRPVDEVLLDDLDQQTALATFLTLVETIERAQAARRLGPADPWEISIHLWIGVHGLVVLELGAAMGRPLEAARRLAAHCRSLCVAFGDDPAAAAASVPDPQRG